MGCHVEDGIGWSMEDPEETFAERRRIARAVTAGIMPPWLAEGGHQQYRHDLSLDDDVIEMIAAWREAGYPKGDPRTDPERQEADPFEFSADLSMKLLPGGSYLPRQDMDDDYRCFVLDWEATERSYVTGFRVVPGNQDIAHHTVVHAVEPDMVDRYRELDEQSQRPGYECFSGVSLPSGADRDAYDSRYPDGREELDEGAWWLAHWAPGMHGHRFPDGTGISMKPGAGLIVQMHYYTKEAPGKPDEGTTVEFELEPAVDRPAFHFPQTRDGWLHGEDNGSMVIPAGETVTYEAEHSLGSLTSYAANVADVDEEEIKGLEIHAANIHMHSFGHSGNVTLTDEDGHVEVLLSIPQWDLHWQRDFVLTEPKVFAREVLDETHLRVQCTYRNDTEEVVYGGYGSYDEMCVNFAYIAVEVGERTADEANRRR